MFLQFVWRITRIEVFRLAEPFVRLVLPDVYLNEYRTYKDKKNIQSNVPIINLVVGSFRGSRPHNLFRVLVHWYPRIAFGCPERRTAGGEIPLVFHVQAVRS